MVNSHFCNKVITIPQYEPTCWFNAILMAILYSQNSRKLLMDNIKLKSNKTKLTKIINQILKYQYVSNKYAEQYFNIMTPQKILKQFKLIKDFEENISNNGWFAIIFLPIFIEKACYKTSITLELYNNDIYIEFYKKLKLIPVINNGINQGVNFHDNNLSDIELQRHIHKIISKPNPDYIFLTIGHESQEEAYSKYLHINSLTIDNIINIKNYNIETKGIKETKDIITYNGDDYILDSCIIGNYNINTIKAGHEIAGITCKNERYVYNGWMRTTNDPAKFINKDIDKDIAKNSDSKLLPCELMKFDWKVKDKDKSFCINPNLCKLDLVKSNDENTKLCFSFGKYFRTLIYVKLSKDYKSVNSNIIESNNSTITLPTISTKEEDIFVDINIKDKKKKLHIKLKDDIKKQSKKVDSKKVDSKKVDSNTDLIIKLQKLKKKENKLQKEIDELIILKKKDDLKKDDLKKDDLKKDDIKKDDLKKDDLKKDDLKKDDLKRVDLKKDDLKRVDKKKDDLKKEDIKIDDYINCLMISLFNSKNKIIEDLILNASIKTPNIKDKKTQTKLYKIAIILKEKLNKLYSRISITRKKVISNTIKKIFIKYYSLNKDLEIDLNSRLLFLELLSNIFDIKKTLQSKDEKLYFFHDYNPEKHNIIKYFSNFKFKELILFINIVKKNNFDIPEILGKIKLNSIIIFDDKKNTYSCIYKYNNLWYEYKENKNYKIGNYETMILKIKDIGTIIQLLYI